MADLTGQSFAGYEIISKLGEGGMGAVYKARQPMLDRLVAIKTITANRAHEPGFVERFMQEAATSAKLNHPNIVQVYTGGEQDGVYYLVEEFVEGENLHDRLHRDGRMDPQEALAVCVFVADGLKHAWDAAQIIHRDIKPGNIFLSNKGAVKVGDLGLAKSIAASAGSGLTQSGMTMGTPYYCSPEQTRADKEIDFRADIYSLGCTLYQMLSGKKPYEGETEQSPMSVMIKQATAPPPAILQVMPDCPSQLVMLLNKMLAKHPSARHASYDALIADLRRLHDLLGQPQANSPISTALRSAVPAKAKKPAPMLIYGGIAAAAAVCVIGLLIWSPWKQSRTGVPPVPSSTLTNGQAGRLSHAVVTELTFSTADVTDLSPLKALPHLQSLTIGGTAQKRTLSDLSPLKGLQLTKLAIHSTAVSDLTPLAGMPLASLQMSNTRVTDLAPLKGAPLTWLSCVDSPVKDLALLADAPLATLWCGGSQVTDFSPLKAVPLKELSCDFQPERDKEALWAIKTLENINGKPAADFWKEVGAPEDPWLKQVAALPAEQQVAAVMAKLKELNPGFDGKETHKLEQSRIAVPAVQQSGTGILPVQSSSDGQAGRLSHSVVSELSFSTVAVTNIVPVRALTALKKLTLLPWAAGGARPPGALSDLSPLQDMPLTFLACGNTRVADLSPLKGMPLTILSVDNTPVSDLSLLAGMPLTVLWCNGTKVTDLSPLAGAPLVELRCDVKPEHAPLLASIPTLRKINDVAPAALWMRMRIKPPVPQAVVERPSVERKSVATATPPRTDAPRSTSAAAAQTGQPFVTSIGMELLYIPPGEFLMGSTPEEQAWAKANKLPEKEVKREGDQPRKTTIKQGFWMGKTEVTVGQWKLFVAATGYQTDAEKKGYADSATTGPGKPWVPRVPGVSWKDPNFGFKLKDNHPACCISWNDAVAFCEWLNEREQKSGRLPPGYKVRLPGEAEWEYACRAGKQTKFWWGETKEGGDNRLNWSGTADGFEFVSPVDHYGARGRNKFGLADMLGNVREWCLDAFDPAGAHPEPDKGNARPCIGRGGSFFDLPRTARCAVRWPTSAAVSFPCVGFRVAVGPEPSSRTSSGTPATTDATQKPPATPPATTTPAAVTPTAARAGAVTLPRSATAAAQTGQPLMTSIGIEMPYIPPGEFMMGSTKEERGWAVGPEGKLDPKYLFESGEPKRTATKQGFWLGRTEVTVGQWKLFVAATGYQTDAEKKGYANEVPTGPGKPWVPNVPGVSWKDPNFGFKLKDNHPVSCITWNDVMAFCEWLNEREQKSGRLPPGYKVRLPSEAEWEYACRAGKQTRFWWGETKEGGENRLNWSGKEDGFEYVSPVDHYGARGRNKFGLADMLGNVKEWCLDEFDETQAHEECYKGNPHARVLRGDSFSSRPGYVRCAYRCGLSPSNSSGRNGFRVCVGVER